MNTPDKSTVLDLLTLIDDHCRSNAVAAVLSTQPTRRAQATAEWQKDVAMASIVRQGMARLACSHASKQEQAQELDAYVRLLVDNFLGESDVGELKAPRPRPRVVPADHRGARREAKGM